MARRLLDGEVVTSQVGSCLATRQPNQTPMLDTQTRQPHLTKLDNQTTSPDQTRPENQTEQHTQTLKLKNLN
ncbi:MAG: hypothetical protein GF381_03180 [Candidatus Pacebacteria bacterium]|nr:hypothetical protein [Candidatus Paceibacterota bacterium]